MPSFVSVDKRPYARSRAATLSSAATDGSFSGEIFDEVVEAEVSAGWALLALRDVDEDMPNGLFDAAAAEDAFFEEECVSSELCGNWWLAVGCEIIGGIEGGGLSSLVYISARILDRPIIAAR